MSAKQGKMPSSTLLWLA